ncbi:MAG: DUF5009 domain-containing protein [Planctomycetota bacterium]
MEHADSPTLQTASATAPPPRDRLLSLDVYRGLIMFLLVGEGAAFYNALQSLDTPWLRPIVAQFHHVEWRGLVLWDLIQPGFMFIVGVAMAFSLTKRAAQGQSWNRQFRHILLRCAILFALGTGLHCIYADALVFELWNVLTQLSFTILLAFLIFRWPSWMQGLVAIGLILATDLAYRFVHVAPYDGTFEPGNNFGTWIDTVLMGKTSGGHWVAINAVPTAAHTIAGCVAGKWLRSEASPGRKVAGLLGVGVALIVLGYAMDTLGVAPIVKRICTSSFVIVSAGWCVAALGVFYLACDVWKWRRGWGVFVVVGMNPILIYMVTEMLAWGWLNPNVGIFVGGSLEALGITARLAAVATAGVTWALLWGLCLWLYQRRIFIRI